MATATQTTATIATATHGTSITPSSIPSSTDIFDYVAAATVEPTPVSPANPAKQRILRQHHHDAMLQAAKDALELGVRNGVNIHIFGAPYKDKVGRRGTHGSCDAVGKFKSGKDQTGLALAPWIGKYLAANPCIRLDYSGLVAIDVDQGFEGLSDEQMIAKAEANGLPRTYTVRTGRANGGATFLYRGSRTLPDVQGFQVGELSGDIKHHGHIAAAGSLHKSGSVYRCISDALFTALPDFWRDYKHTKKAKPAPLTPFQEDCLRKADLLRNADTSPLGFARKRAYDYEIRLRERLATGEVVIVEHGELIPQGRRLKYLTQQAGRMRKLSLDPEIIRIALDIRAIRKCWDSKNFILSHKANLDYVCWVVCELGRRRLRHADVEPGWSGDLHEAAGTPRLPSRCYEEVP